MAPRDEDLRAALEMVPINILRKIIEERGLDVTSRKSDELIEALISDGWTDDDFNDLKGRLARIQIEQNPHSRFISNIVAIDPGLEGLDEAERVEQVLRLNQSDFDDNNELIEEGFEVKEISPDEIHGIHWTESINYALTPMGEIKKEQTLYETGFRFDLDDGVLFIDCSLPAKARSLQGELAELNIRTGEIGHENLANPRANELVQEFVSVLKGELEDRNSQATIVDDSATHLEVDLINMLLDESELKDIKIGGRTDIMENEEVRRFRREHDSRIVRMEGEFNLENNWFEFKVGYTEGMGYISVEKKGRVEERPELVTDAFDFLYEVYHEYFIAV